MKYLFISLLFVFIVSFTDVVYSRTRNDFVQSAQVYINTQWTCVKNNLLDLYDNETLPEDTNFSFSLNLTSSTKRSDGIDDRKGNPSSDSRWPFNKDQTYTGMAYAYGGMDTPSGFATKLASSQKYIAGARDVDHRQHAPEGYAGYAGIDCSGLVSRLVGISEDGTLVTDQIEISNSGADYELKYVPLATAEAGTHDVSVSVQNAFGLQEYYEFSYTLVETADSDRDGMPDSWELEMGVRASICA